MSEVLRLEGISKTYNSGTAAEISVLSDLDLTLQTGEVAALVAPSGAGKSTLLHIAGLLDQPSAGQVTVLGKPVMQNRDREKTRLRRDEIGFVYQFHHLLPEFDALENVGLPLRAAGHSRQTARERAGALLEQVGLGHRLGHRPAEMSGGEQQRVAVARALANSPRLLLADEPTGNLDPETSDQVFDVLMHLVRDTGLAALIATHNPVLAERMDKNLVLKDGTISG